MDKIIKQVKQEGTQDTVQDLITVPQRDISPMTLLEQALEKGVAPETIEKFMNLKDRWDAKQAKQAFDDAMANFQGECPIIKKGTTVKDSSGKSLYSYAKIESIISQVRPFLKKNGFSYKINLEMAADKVKAICIAKHVDGHSESSDIEIPMGTKTGIMSAPQQSAATATFAKRYAFCNAFGIMTGDDDTDSNNPKEAKKVADIAIYEAKIKAAGSIDELKKIFSDLPADVKLLVKDIASHRKAELGGAVPK